MVLGGVVVNHGVGLIYGMAEHGIEECGER